jgi:hypothetical protein
LKTEKKAHLNRISEGGVLNISISAEELVFKIDENGF